jgi:hypothetical protein
LGPTVGLGDPHFPKKLCRLGGEGADSGLAIIAGKNPRRAFSADLGKKPRAGVEAEAERVLRIRDSWGSGHVAPLPRRCLAKRSDARMARRVGANTLAAIALTGKNFPRRLRC